MSDFNTPEKLKVLFEAQSENISTSDFIRKPQHKHLKEIWCALQFGLGYEKHVAPCWIAVNKEENSDTDFILKTESCQFPFQTTIADMPGRRMGDEYKQTQTDSLPNMPSQIGGLIEGPQWILNAVVGKIEKKYSALHTLNLLVYANFSSFELGYIDTVNALEKHSGKFSSVWIITNSQICSIHTAIGQGAINYYADIYNHKE